VIEITCKECVHTEHCNNSRKAEPNHNNCGIDYGYAFDHEKFEYDCGNCQREDAPCDYCTRNEENTDKENPNLEDLYFHEEVSNE